MFRFAPLLLVLAAPAHAKDAPVMTVDGTFEVKLTPVASPDNGGASSVGGMTIAKTFAGGLTGTSAGQMLAVRTAVEGSAGYVAMETVTGTLDGKTGSFALQHSGTMTRGAPTLAISVVPDSGTGALAGIAGTMTIDITDGRHLYTFRYSLPG